MPLTKLTLSADKKLIEDAKKLAEEQGTSLSSMISRYLEAVLRVRHQKTKLGPLTRKALGLVKLPSDKSDRELLEEALLEKYAE